MPIFIPDQKHQSNPASAASLWDSSKVLASISTLSEQVEVILKQSFILWLLSWDFCCRKNGKGHGRRWVGLKQNSFLGGVGRSGRTGTAKHLQNRLAKMVSRIHPFCDRIGSMFNGTSRLLLLRFLQVFEGWFRHFSYPCGGAKELDIFIREYVPGWVGHSQKVVHSLYVLRDKILYSTNSQHQQLFYQHQKGIRRRWGHMLWQ